MTEPKPITIEREIPTPPMMATDEIKAEVVAFMRSRPFAQLFTVDREGFPVGRAVGIDVYEDWRIETIQARKTGRVRQALRWPRVTAVWGDGAPNKMVYVRGTIETIEGDALLEAYRRRTERILERGAVWGPIHDEDVLRVMIGFRIVPVSVRTERFDGGGMGVWEWRVP